MKSCLIKYKTGIVANNGTGEVSVDQYHRYKVSGFFFFLTMNVV